MTETEKFAIRVIKSREILDSRGNPTVETDLFTGCGWGRASVPSGASTGTYEAVELRDGGDRYDGKSVLTACCNVEREIAPAVIGMDVRRQADIDRRMITLDGTENKSRLGANAILSVSLAAAKAAASSSGKPLFEYLNPEGKVMPVPMMNVINGGKHAGNGLAIQEFMIVPIGAYSMRDAVRIGSEVYMGLKALLRERYGPSAINVGDEGGFAPPISDSREALRSLVDAVKRSGYTESDVRLAIDAAASSFYKDGEYSIDGRSLSAGELLDYYAELCSEFPIISLEDPFEEDDYSSLTSITSSLGKSVQIIGDDIFVTNPKRFGKGADLGAANALLLKVNQIGSLTESVEVANMAFGRGYAVVVSHRSGETEDNYIADLAVALNTGQIKTGAPARGERTSKYNQLLRIEEVLGSKAVFPGAGAFGRRHRR